MRELGLTHINKIKANLSNAGKSARTQQYVFRTFSMVWNAALDHGIVSGPSPTKLNSFRLPKVDNERGRYLTIDEETTLLEYLSTRNKQAHDMTIVSLDAGLRFGEIASLTWGCVDTDNGVIRILDTKTGKDRNVPLTTRLKELFLSMPTGNQGALVFPSEKGGAHTEAPRSFRNAVTTLGFNDGIENKKMRVCFHTCRHTSASKMVQAGVDLYRVQRILGHSTPVMTARYGKLADKDLKDAIEKMETADVVKQSNGKVLPLRRTAEDK
jgi:integrase